MTQISTLLNRYPILRLLLLLDISIILKERNLEREGDITGLIEVTVMGGCIMERYVLREPLGFTMAVLGSTTRPTNVNKLAVTALQQIMTP